MSYTEEELNEMIEELKEYPKDSKKWHAFGVALLAVARHEEAERAFEHSLKLDQNNPLALGDLGGIYLLKGKPKEATKYLEKSLELAPENHEFWSALGLSYLQRNKFKDAIRAYEKCLVIQPDYFQAIISMGLINYRMEKWEKAIEYLEKATHQEPDNYEALKALARSYLKLKRIDELEKTYLTMLKINPEDNSLLIYLGQLAFDSGRHEDGLNYYYDALKKDPQLIMAWKMLGQSLERLGRTKEAAAAMENYQKLMDGQKKLSGLFG